MDLVIGPKDGALIVLAVITAVALVGWLFRKDDKIEGRRKEAVKIAQFLREQVGLEIMPRFFTDYAVGDYSGMWAEAKSALSVLDSPDLRDATIRRSLDTMLKQRLNDPQEVARLAELVAKAKPAAANAA